jgi:hypothetical protein
MTISDLIIALDAIRQDHGDLLVVHYSSERHWEPITEVGVHPAGRPHGRRKTAHADKVVEIGGEW